MKELAQDKVRVLEHLKTTHEFMPYLHSDMTAGDIEHLLGSKPRAWRALMSLVQDKKIRYLENCSPDSFQAYAEVEPPPALDDTERDLKAAEFAGSIREAHEFVERARSVRATIAPRPELHYPAPWRTTTPCDDGVTVLAADGYPACQAPTMESAEAIVVAVNAFAGVSE